MKGGTQAAMAIGIGYLLGRRRKMRMATVMAAAAATGSLGGIGGAALRRGAKMLGSTEMLSKVSPQLGGIVDTVRGDLLDAGKAAAAAAVNGRIESLTDSLHDRAETLRNPAATAAKTGEQAGETVRGAGRRGRKLAGRDEPDEVDEYDEYDEVDDAEAEPDEFDEAEDQEPEPAPRRRRSSSRAGAPVARARR
jgi:hypothetical protein